MASVYRQAAIRRKVIYLACIFVLFLSTLVVRGNVFGVSSIDINQIAPPIDDKTPDTRKTSDRILAMTLEGQARNLEATELTQGEVQLAGSAIRLILTGSRGLASAALWWSASEKQRNAEWNELDLLVKSITTLQPNYDQPWLFQSWNIAYNVSVEMDRLNDMYYYIAHGIGILAEGEQMNRNNPNIRYMLAFYYQNKFGVSDKVTTLRSLYQLSCIPPAERDPDSFYKDGKLDLDKFEQFVRKNPQLVRRLKETLLRADGQKATYYTLARTPEDVVRFLRNNRDVKTRYTDEGKLNPDRLKQFPVLPDLRNVQLPYPEISYQDQLTDDKSDPFLAARAWYSLSTAVIPPPKPDEVMVRTINPNPKLYRIPKRPMMILFRQGPMRAQHYVAERLTREGWFGPPKVQNRDGESWDPDALTLITNKQWFPARDGKPRPEPFTTQASAQEAWRESYTRWANHGKATGLFYEPAALSRMIRNAEAFASRRPDLRVGDRPPPLTLAESKDEVIREQYKAFALYNQYINWRSVTNFESFLIESDALQREEATIARRAFYLAERYDRMENDYGRAAEQYLKGFEAWKKVLGHRSQNSSSVSLGPETIRNVRDYRDLEKTLEETYEKNLQYLQIVRETLAAELRQSTVSIFDVIPNFTSTAVGIAPWNTLFQKLPDSPLNSVAGLPIDGPFDGLDPEGQPWIPEAVKNKVKAKLGLIKAPPAPGEPGGPPLGGPNLPPGPGGMTPNPIQKNYP